MSFRKYYIYLWLVLAALCLRACANKGIGPQGGPKDTTPPEILNVTPANGSVNFSGNTIVIQCNEYLQMKDAANQVLMSPPQRRAPIVKALGKKVVVTFEEPLRDSTTYLIDFGKSICDLNEGNPIESYAYAFSTGSEIDTLQMSGVLVHAENLNPMSDVLIGLHDDLRDSAFLNKVFVSIARTDEKGHFTLRNLHAGKYHIYALNDISKDYVYQPGEGLAFSDSLFIPIAIDTFVVDVPEQKTDSLPLDSLPQDSAAARLPADSLPAKTDSLPAKNDSLPAQTDAIEKQLLADSSYLSVDSSAIMLPADSLLPDSLQADTVVQLKKITRYEPSNILLKYFEENKRKMYFVRCLREEPHFFRLLFASPQDSMPLFDSLPPSYIQMSKGMDTITVWLQDSAYIKQDTIEFAMTYQLTDSVYNIRWQTDTIAAIYRAPKLTPQQEAARKREKAKAPKPVLEIKNNASSSFDIYQQLKLTFAWPLEQWEPDSLRLWHVHPLAEGNDPNAERQRDSVDFEFVKLDSCGSQFAIKAAWEAGQQYELEIDSAAFTSIYGVSSDKQVLKLGIKTLEDYATLIMKIEPFNPKMMIQVLSEKDEPVRTLRASEEGARFEYLNPESYYIRIYEDVNGDSVWTTGDWLKHRQPEPVYYFDRKLTLKANWDFEETFNYLEKAVLEQKPQELRKDAGGKKNK